MSVHWKKENEMKDARLDIRIPRVEREQAHKLARSRGVTLSELMRSLLKEAADELAPEAKTTPK